jgi:putative flippase GtrA
MIRNPMFTRWCKFNLVGAVGIIVQLSALFVMKGVLHLNYLASTALAVEAAILHNFGWHERFTWADRIGPKALQAGWHKSVTRLLRFHLTNGAVSICGNMALMKVLAGMGYENYLLSNAMAIAVCSLANFAMSERWVFGNAVRKP